MKTKSQIWTREDLENSIKNSVTIADALKKLGLKPRGANYSTIRKFIKEWNIDTSHILGRAYLKGKARETYPVLSLEEIMVENSNYYRHKLKKRLINENILLNECGICGQKPEWNNKNLVMVLDHINGINNDNRIENLRLLCPNCNSQQDTFCGRNNKKTYRCIDCGKEIYKGSERCEKCSQLLARKVDRPSYAQIKKDLETISMVGVGKKYGVSDNAIRKWIKQYEKGITDKYQK